MDLEAIFAWIGGATAIVTPIAGFGLWLGKTYIDRWLTRRFQGQLDALKHAQAQEIERLRARIAALLDRASKLHQHEFEVLPKAWDLLTSAIGSVASVTATFKEAVDPGAMSPGDLEVLLRNSPLEEHHKQAVRDADRFSKPRMFQDFMDRYQFNAAQTDAQAFHNYVIQYGIFIEPEIREKLTQASSELRIALRTWKQILEMPEVKPWPIRETQKHVEKASDLSKQIDALISDRLWSAAKLDA